MTREELAILFSIIIPVLAFDGYNWWLLWLRRDFGNGTRRRTVSHVVLFDISLHEIHALIEIVPIVMVGDDSTFGDVQCRGLDPVQEVSNLGAFINAGIPMCD